MDEPTRWIVLFCAECSCAFDVPKRPGRRRSVCDECRTPAPRVLLSREELLERDRERKRRYRQTPAGRATKQRELQRRRAAAA